MVGSKQIVLITDNFPYGGASANLLRNFTLCLRNEGNDIEVILPTGASYGKKLDQQNQSVGYFEGIKFTRLGFIYHPKNILGKMIDNTISLFLPLIFLTKKAFNKKLDVVIVYNITAISFIPYLITKIILKKELILIISEFYQRPLNRFPLATLKWFNFYFGIKYLSKFADKYIVLSQFLEKYLAKKQKNSKPILVMPNLTDSSIFKIEPKKIFKENFITIGYVGTPTNKDGVFDLIESFGIINKKFPQTHLLIIGDITNGKTIVPMLEKYSTERGIKKGEITFNGLTSHKEIPSLLLSCQILALTRPNGIFAEAGFPTKLGEYFACKKPVVLTKVGDMKNYFIDKKEVVFAEPENIDSIVTAFEYLIKNPNEGYKIGANGYDWMNDNLNYINQSKKIDNFVKHKE